MNNHTNQEFLIVTGLSGAGKSKAVNALEDIGFFCVDNLPPQLLFTFTKLIMDSKEKRDKIAVVLDIRLGSSFKDVIGILDNLKNEHINYQILFIDADTEVLERRFQETRRKHPLFESFNTPNITAAIESERKIMIPIREKADFVIDTSNVMSSQFKERIATLFMKDAGYSLKIYATSFGFKYGIPNEADLVFDVRCLPNPFYVPDLKPLTGLDKEVHNFVMRFHQATELQNKLFDLIDFLIPLYLTEGKSQLTIAVGCTGGKHRSVLFAELINKHLIENGHPCAVFHRDIRK